jgi:hypothetical protein
MRSSSGFSGIDGSVPRPTVSTTRLRAVLASELAADPLAETEAVYRGALARTQSRSTERVIKAASDGSMVGARGRIGVTSIATRSRS